MPELPEVETVARGLEKVFVGRTIRAVTVRRRDLRTPLPKTFEADLKGRKVLALRRRAKYVLMDLSGGRTLLVHLGMSGTLTFQPTATPPAKHDHVLLAFDKEPGLRFNDPRRFGLMALADTHRLNDHPLLAHLGPEPLEPSFTGAALRAALNGRTTALKVALMDNAVVVGVGNIYASESLFRAKLSPFRAAGTLTAAEATRLVKAVKDVLADAIASGGSTLRDYVRSDGSLGYFSHHFAVYDRAGQPCPVCGTAIAKKVQAQRTTYYCKKCQHV